MIKKIMSRNLILEKFQLDENTNCEEFFKWIGLDHDEYEHACNEEYIEFYAHPNLIKYWNISTFEDGQELPEKLYYNIGGDSIFLKWQGQVYYLSERDNCIFSLLFQEL